MVRAALAMAAAAAIILSAPFVQQGFDAVSDVFPSIGVTATVLPIGAAILLALLSIRERRRLRFAALALSVAIAVTYVLIDELSVIESFHFVEYGLLACLIYAALVQEDGSLLVLPVVGGIATGIVDEWFQWFVPIRVGEMRDVALDAAASLCGVCFAVSLRPPPHPTLALAGRSVARVAMCVVGTLALFGFFIMTAHVGHEVRDPAIGTFLSRYTGRELSALARDRAERWRRSPPVTVRRFSAEDQYLSEGLWHVQRRNRAWEDGNFAEAWRENLILETFFAPVLDAPTYAGAAGQRWSPEHRADAASRPGVDRRPSVSAEYRYPLYVF